jgi:hypothetical protein
MKRNRIMKISKQNIAVTAAKFEAENGARHEKLQALRDADKVQTKGFERLYAAEARWLERNGIKYSPSHRAWYTVGYVDEAEAEAETEVAAKPAKRAPKEAPADDKETVLRKFLRATFGAKIAADRKGNELLSVRARKGVATIVNADRVMLQLSQQAKLVRASTKGCVFQFGKGKKQATISLLQVGKAFVLTMKPL